LSGLDTISSGTVRYFIPGHICSCCCGLSIEVGKMGSGEGSDYVLIWYVLRFRPVAAGLRIRCADDLAITDCARANSALGVGVLEGPHALVSLPTSSIQLIHRSARNSPSLPRPSPPPRPLPRTHDSPARRILQQPPTTLLPPIRPQTSPRPHPSSSSSS
jgi:hypothetical protein